MTRRISLSMNSSIILPPAYFPPVHWVSRLLNAQNTTIDMHSWYQKQQLSSRTWILGPEGAICLTIPVERRNSKAALYQKKVSYQDNWPETHFRSLINFYSNSPYFEFWKADLRDFFSRRPPYLIDWIEGSMRVTEQLLGETLSWTWSTDFIQYQQDSGDLRKAFPSHPGRAIEWFEPIRYQQVFEPFTPRLSILDALFSKGRETPMITKSGLKAGLE